MPTYTGPEPTAEIEGAKIYHGSCHCGAVTIAVKSKDFHKDPDATSEKGLFSCGCSICARVSPNPSPCEKKKRIEFNTNL